MLEKIREKYRKGNEEADERSVKSWQKHPRLNKGATFLFAGSMAIGATIVVILALFGYITQEISMSITIVSIVCSVGIYGFAVWILKYSEKIAKKAFPKQS